MNEVVHTLTVSQYVRLDKRAKALGKTVPEYLSFFFEGRVGTTPVGIDVFSALPGQGKVLSA